MALNGGTWWRFPGWPNPAWVVGNSQSLGSRFKVAEMMAPSIPPARLHPNGTLGHISIPSTSRLRGLRQMPPATGLNLSNLSPVALLLMGLAAGYVFCGK